MRFGILALAALALLPAAWALDPGDLNGDGLVDIQDVLSIVPHIGRGRPYAAAADINADGAVNILDLTRVTTHWRKDYWTAAPSRSSLGPSGQLAAGIGSATLQVTTNASANCSYSTTPSSAYTAMVQFTNTDALIHTTTVAVQDGRSYTYYVKCRDAEGRTNRNDATISFSVADSGGVQPFFEDYFDSYTRGVTVAGNGANGFVWGGSSAEQPRTTTELAFSGQQSLKFPYGPLEPDGSTHWWSELRFLLGRQVQELWIEFYIYHPQGTEAVLDPTDPWNSLVSGPTLNRYRHRTSGVGYQGPNNKYMRIWGGATGYDQEGTWGYSAYPIDNTGNNAVVHEYSRYDPVGYGLAASTYGSPRITFVTDDLRGRWVQVRVYNKMASAPSVTDGIGRVWVDGELILERTNADSYGDANPYTDRGYLMGYDNTGFDETTFIYLDSVKFYDQDPGWMGIPPSDTTPPLRAAGSPTVELPSGTTNATLSLTTDEASTCRYSATPGAAYASMTAFGASGETSHSTLLSGLQDGQSYTRYVKCRDAANNTNTDDYPIAFSIAAHTTPPLRTDGQPNTTLAVGTRSATITLSTDEPATCRFSQFADTAYAAMTLAFTGVGTTSHSFAANNMLADGTTYTVYVRCQDSFGNANPDDYLITFSVAAPAGTPPTISAGSPSGSLQSGTANATLRVTTNEAATCRYSTTGGVAYASMTSTFATTGNTAHSTDVYGLTDGQTYRYYVRCQDAEGMATTADYQISFSVGLAGPGNANIIFLHHSTGSVIRSGGFISQLYAYNRAAGTNYLVTDREYPKASPYGWANYPYDYWNIWVNHAGPQQYMTEDTLEILTQQYDVVMFKHCYPVSHIAADNGNALVSLNANRAEVYKLQYAALKDKMHEFPDTKFIVWTGAALLAQSSTPEEGARAREFFRWVKEDWDEPGDNIYVWDFYELETEGTNFLLVENARSSTDNHPNVAFATEIAPFLSNRIVDVIEGRGDTGSLTGQ